MKESRSVEKETKGRDLTSFRKKNEQNKFEVMRWRCICWEGVKTMAPVEEKISSLKYREILEESSHKLSKLACENIEIKHSYRATQNRRRKSKIFCK